MGITPDKIVRSRRKTLALVVEGDGTLTIRAPLRAADASIAAFIAANEAWIREKQRAAKERLARHGIVEGFDGDIMSYLGKEYVLVRSEEGNIRIEGGMLLLPREADSAALAAWLKLQALSYIRGRVAYYAELMGARCGTVKVTEAKTRWGSCSCRNNLCFAWRLIMTPPETIDYVVVHELTHIAHKNHSAAFWSAVAETMPDYKARRAWLREHSAIMHAI